MSYRVSDTILILPLVSPNVEVSCSSHLSRLHSEMVSKGLLDSCDGLSLIQQLAALRLLSGRNWMCVNVIYQYVFPIFPLSSLKRSISSS
jgi:hypothetical protein